jgi:predicted GIY-YIG superfamily endonuclease
MDYGRDKRQTDGLNRYCKPCHRGNCTKARAVRHKPCVYQLFFTDGCTYIGSTIQNFHDRLSVHRAKIRKKIHTNKLFNQYESEDISGRIIMYVQDEQELRMNEYVLIKHFKELYGSKCLNAYFTTGILNENKRQKNEETRNVEEN